MRGPYRPTSTWLNQGPSSFKEASIRRILPPPGSAQCRPVHETMRQHYNVSVMAATTAAIECLAQPRIILIRRYRVNESVKQIVHAHLADEGCFIVPCAIQGRRPVGSVSLGGPRRNGMSTTRKLAIQPSVSWSILCVYVGPRKGPQQSSGYAVTLTKHSESFHCRPWESGVRIVLHCIRAICDASILKSPLAV